MPTKQRTFTRIKKWVLVYLLCMPVILLYAQPDDNLQANAKMFMQQGDFSNATLLLTKALQSNPSNPDLIKDLALAYYFQKENEKALQTILPLLDKEEGDDQCFQIAGNIYLQGNNVKECEKLYKKGIKRFPESGPLYNQFGELLFAQQNFVSAIEQWEKGIEVDPGYSKNYYHAARYYYFTTDKIWSLLYGEIFLNLEPSGTRTIEMKELLLEGYKKLYTDIGKSETLTSKSPFERAVAELLKKQQALASMAISPETLTMIRTRFILEWNQNYAERFPFRLFEYQRELIREGFFDAYSQWAFGTVQNLPAFQNWTKNNEENYQEFLKLQKSRLFKLPKGQYYRSL